MHAAETLVEAIKGASIRGRKIGGFMGSNARVQLRGRFTGHVSLNTLLGLMVRRDVTRRKPQCS